MTFLKTVLLPAIAVIGLGLGAASAQTTPAPAPAPATAQPAPATAAPAMKAKPRSAASLACSGAADKQSLHGKARKSFMSDCKKKGGPA